MAESNTIIPTGPVTLGDGFIYTPAPAAPVGWPSCAGCVFENQNVDCSLIQGEYTCISGDKYIIFHMVM